MLMPAPADDKLIGRYVGESTRWTTATPVVLPGHDHRRGKPRPQRSLARLLRHAGIPEALVDQATFEPAPRLRGSLRALDCRLPSHLAGLPTAHISVSWTIPIPGPIALGAGVGYGFGVFAGC
jgi:CRISPR-associated protein Csb2